MTKRIRVDARTVKIAGILCPEGSDVPTAIDLEVTGEVSVRTVAHHAVEPAAIEHEDDLDDLPFMSAPLTVSQLEVDALAIVWAHIIAALHDDELVRLTRQGALDGEQRMDIERSIVRALRAKAGGFFSRPDFASLQVRVSNAARNVEDLARAVSSQADLLARSRGGRLDGGATGAARTAADAMAQLVREMELLDQTVALVKPRAGGAPRKAWRADLIADLSIGGEIFDRIAEAACDAVDAIHLGRPETVTKMRKNLREKS
jgi:hypothetical protein